MPYIMSIEYEHGKSVVDGFHLGTDEKIARELIVERFHGRLRSYNAGWSQMFTVTIALMLDNRIVDVYDGTSWAND